MTSRVFIGRLSHRASERDVEHFFRGYGKIREVVLKNGFGFAEFEYVRDAEDAIYDLNGKDLAGERVTLEMSRSARSNDRFGGRDRRAGGDRFGGGGGRFGGDRRDRFGPPTKTRHRLIVENLSSRVSWQDLKDMMRPYGEVTFADAHKVHPNEGTLCFASRKDLLRAMEKMQGKDVNGRELKLIDDSEDKDKKESRSRSRTPKSRSRSRSRHSSSRSKSRSRSPRDRKEKEKENSHSPSPLVDKDNNKEKSRSRSASASSAASNKSE